MAAIKKLKSLSDVFLVDAQGLAHPHMCGFASHLGLSLRKPTVGAAKSRLIGVPSENEGRTWLADNNEVIGEVVTTKIGAKPIYISIGHMVSLNITVKIVQHCSKGRIPEPLLQAHNIATKQRIKFANESKVNI